MEFRTLIKHKPGTELDIADEIIKLEPGPDGYCTFSTDNPEVIERLLQIPEGFAPLAPADTKPGDFVLVDGGGEELDLSALGDQELHAFAAENALKIHHRLKGDNARAAIVAQIKARK